MQALLPEQHKSHTDTFEKFFALYSQWNQKINISSIREKTEVYNKHFYDSLIITPLINLQNKKILDIGTGGGFPLIPLAITTPNAQFIGLDSVQKKLNIIQDIAQHLKLTNIQTIHARAETLAHNPQYREQFDIVTSRAFAKVSPLIEMSLPFIKIGGKLIAYQTPNIEPEFQEKIHIITKLGGEIENIHHFSLPKNMGERSIFIIKKVSQTPKNFPREIGIPRKKELSSKTIQTIK